MLVYRLLADLVLIVHFTFVVFVVGGLLVIVAGRCAKWAWVRNGYFRLGHLLAVGVVVAQAWLGVVCPLTVWENALRSQAGDATYPGAFIAYWVDRALFHQAPTWAFAVAYTAFGLLVLASLLLVPPRRP